MSDFEVVLRRQWDMMRQLTSSQKGLTLVDLAERFGVSEKTIKRDLMTLHKVFGPWNYKNEAHGRKRYSYDSQTLSFSDVLNHDELFAIYLGATLTHALHGTKVGRYAEAGLEKIRKTLREPAMKMIDRFSDVCRHVGDFEPKTLKIIDAIYEAMCENRVLTVKYRSINSKVYKTYDVCPYKLHFQNNSVYLAGLCCVDKKIKFWKINRLLSAEFTPDRQSFVFPEGFDESEHLANGFVLFGKGTEDKVKRVTLRLTGFAARNFEEAPPCKISSLTRQSDDSIIVELDVEINDPFYNAILNYGENAEILAPQDLRDALMLKIDALKERYQRSEGNPVDYYRNRDGRNDEEDVDEYREAEGDEDVCDIQEIDIHADVHNPTLIGIARKRGRPRKYPIKPDGPKRRRGRPRKEEALQYAALMAQRELEAKGGTAKRNERDAKYSRNPFDNEKTSTIRARSLTGKELLRRLGRS